MTEQPNYYSGRAKTFLLLCTVILITSCENSNSGYFPLTQGWSWQYDIENKTINEIARQKEIIRNLGRHKEGPERTFVRKSVSGITSYYLRNSEALLLNHEVFPDGTTKTPDDVRATIFRYPLTSGSSWKGVMTTSTLRTYDAYAHDVRERIPVSVSIESMDDTVIVPAGKFRRCMRIVTKGEKLVQKGKYAYQPTMTISIVNTRWYAEGVGLVKEEHLEESDVLQYPKASYVIRLDKYENG